MGFAHARPGSADFRVSSQSNQRGNMFKRIEYKKLNSKQQENYNFHKIASRLADYGYNSILLSDDWEGADFIACHINGKDFLKVQLKGRMVVDKKYLGKDIFIACRYNDKWYLYPHDKILNALFEQDLIKDTKSWEEKGNYSWPRLTKTIESLISVYKI